MDKNLLKILSDKTFFDNKDWAITPANHRQFNDELIEAITLQSETDNIQDALNAETETRQDADDAIHGRIDKLNSDTAGKLEEVNEALITLGNELDAETEAREIADTALGVRIDTLTSDSDTKFGEMNAALEAETESRETADTALGVRIDTLASDTDTKFGEVNAALEAETETRETADIALGVRIYTLASDTDTKFGEVNAALEAETEAREIADTALGVRIDTLTSDSDTKFGEMNAALEAETESRETADTALGVRIDTLASDTDTKFSEVNAALEAEAEARENADNALDVRIGTLASDTDTKFGEVNAALEAEAEVRENADTALAVRIDTQTSNTDTKFYEVNADLEAEVEARKNADTALGIRIDTLTSDTDAKFGEVNAALEAETEARENADIALDGRIDALSTDTSEEVGELKEALESLGNNLDIETESRKNADTALDGRIDALVTEVNKKIEDAVCEVTYDADEAILTISYEKGSPKTINLPKENFLSEAEYDPETNILELTLVDGFTFSVDMTDLVDVYTAGNGLVESGNEFSLKLDASTENYILVSANGVKITGIDAALARKQDNLTAGENIKIENNVISSSVPEEYAEKTYVDENIKALKIGGINLLDGTYEGEGWELTSTAYGELTVSEGVFSYPSLRTDGNATYIYNTNPISYKAGQTYTVSFLAKKTGTAYSESKQAGVFIYTANSTSIGYDLFELTDEWNFFSFQYTPEVEDADGLVVRFYNYGTGEEGEPFELDLKNIKLEKGSYATDYNLSVGDTIRITDDLQNALNTEAETRRNADAALGSRIDALTTETSGEIEELKEAIETLHDNLETESETRQNTDVALDGRIDALTSDTNTKLGEVNSSLESMSNELEAETEARKNADMALENRMHSALDTKQDILTAGDNIEIENNIIRSSVPEEYAKKTDVEEKINALEIGGTNLLNGTYDGSGWRLNNLSFGNFTVEEGVFIFPSTRMETTVTFITNSIGIPYEENKEYTLSFKLKKEGTSFNPSNMGSFGVYIDNTSFQVNTFVLSDEWQDYKYTFTTPVDATKELFVRFNNRGTGVEGEPFILYIKDIKLEEGNWKTSYNLSVKDSVNVFGKLDIINPNLVDETYTQFSMVGEDKSNQTKIMYYVNNKLRLKEIVPDIQNINISFDWKITGRDSIINENAKIYFFLVCIEDDQTNRFTGISSNILTISSDTGLFSTTYNGTHSSYRYIPDGCYVQARFDNIPDTVTLEISNFKLEYGTRATRWCMSIPDMENQFTGLEVETEARQDADIVLGERIDELVTEVNKKIEEAVTDVVYDADEANLIISYENSPSKNINLPKENFLSAANYDPATRMLELSLVDGSSFSVDMADLVDIYTAGNGLVESGNEFSIQLDSTSENYLVVSGNGIKVTGINAALETKQDLLTAGDNIKIENNVIRSSVPEEYAKKTDVDERINGIEIGGTNLLNGTYDGEGWVRSNISDTTLKIEKGKFIFESYSTVVDSIGLYQFQEYKPGEKFTLSFWYKTEGVPNSHYCLSSEIYTNQESVIERVSDLQEEWTYYKVTFTIPSSFTDEKFSFRFWNFGPKNAAVPFIIYLKNVKLEKGTFATDYDLSVTDIQRIDQRFDDYLSLNGGILNGTGDLALNYTKLHFASEAGNSGIRYMGTQGVILESAQNNNLVQDSITVHARGLGNINLNAAGKVLYNQKEVATQDDIQELTGNIDEVSDKIDSIQIGGTNILSGTQDGWGWYVYNYDFTSSVKDGLFTLQSPIGSDRVIYSPLVSYEKEKTYTISFRYRNEGNPLFNNSKVRVIEEDGTSFLDFNFDHSEDWKQAVFQFTPKTDWTKTNLQIRIFNTGAAEDESFTLFVKDLKLEQGDIATDYSLSTRDILNVTKSVDIVNPNLADGTSKPYRLTGNNTNNQAVVVYNVNNGLRVKDIFPEIKFLTVSFNWELTGRETIVNENARIQFRTSGRTDNGETMWPVFTNHFLTETENEKGHFTCTYNLSSTAFLNLIYAYRVGFRFDYIPNTVTLKISNFKLEYGTKATRWCMSVPDMKTLSISLETETEARQDADSTLGNHIDALKTEVDSKAATSVLNVLSGKVDGIDESVKELLDYKDEGMAASVVNTHDNKALSFWAGTQAEYDLLTTKSSTTLYIITDA